MTLSVDAEAKGQREDRGSDGGQRCFAGCGCRAGYTFASLSTETRCQASFERATWSGATRLKKGAVHTCEARKARPAAYSCTCTHSHASLGDSITAMMIYVLPGPW